MLTIKVNETEYYENSTNTFYSVPAYTLQLEHSLSSLSEWEAITKKPFLEALSTNGGLTPEDTFLYIKCMTLNKPDDEKIYYSLNKDDIRKIQEYIDDPHTATTISSLKEENGSKKKQIITAELIYYWMIEGGIPLECENWNLNRLITLIRVISIKRDNGKMSKRDLRNFNKAEMARRRAKRGH